MTGSARQSGSTPDQDWFVAADWEEVPSEHWAEAVVQYVIGFRLAHPGGPSP